MHPSVLQKLTNALTDTEMLTVALRQGWLKVQSLKETYLVTCRSSLPFSPRVNDDAASPDGLRSGRIYVVGSQPARVKQRSEFARYASLTALRFPA